VPKIVCGISNSLTLAVNVLTVPAQPSAISGNTTLCGGSANSYSISTVAGATSYTWTLPMGWTGGSTSNTMNATAGSTSGDITVTSR
jgi:hypothetical protein